MEVYVLLFNARTENEGIHTVRLGEQNLVLMFEDEDDATRYSLLLEAQDFPTATVEGMDREEIEEFCQSAGYEFQIVPKGFVPQNDAERLLMVPPETNLEKTDWQLDQSPTDEPESSEPMQNEALEQIRRKLEGLL